MQNKEGTPLWKAKGFTSQEHYNGWLFFNGLDMPTVIESTEWVDDLSDLEPLNIISEDT